MSANRLFIAFGIGALLLAGCDSKPAPSHAQQTAPPAAPATQPAEQASAIITPAAIAPTTRPVHDDRTFTITENGVKRPFAFPSARLHIDREQKTAVLYSDDPKAAINPNYVGNSYYLVIPLTDDALEHLDGYQWNFKAVSSEHQDSLEGIFLEGQRYDLQPLDIMVVFRGDGPKLQVAVGGDFFKFDKDQKQPEPSLVRVSAIVNATVEFAK